MECSYVHRPDSALLYQSVTYGAIEAPNRFVMAPLTRCRAGAGFVPHELNAMYYAQRASAGLIVSEATQISQQGMGYPDTPGIYSDEQVRGWQLVTDAVHAAGGRIVAQLWHVGRVSHPDFQPNGALPVAPSAIGYEGEVRTPTGRKKRIAPRALETDEITGIVADYARAAENAQRAGFDGVEIHGANGYLIEQFIRDGSNQRTDQYGGSIENRTRFMREVVEAVVDAWSADRVGIRLSPNATYQGMEDSDPKATFTHAVRLLDRYGLAFVHLIEAMDSDRTSGVELTPMSHFRANFNGPIIVNGGFTRERAITAIAEGWADAIAFGRLYIANPDLVDRFRRVDAPLNPLVEATLYGGGAEGYTDYPFLDEVAEPCAAS